MTECHRFEDEGLLRLEQGEPLDPHFATCPDCLEARAAYEHLQAALAEAGADEEPPPGWQAGVWQRLEERRRRPRWLWTFVPLGAAAALAAILFFAIPRPSAVPSLTQEIAAGDTAVRSTSAHPGDRLRLRAETGGAPHAELRLYRNGRDLLLQCPGSPACRREGTTLQAELVLPAPGTYQSVFLSGTQPLPPPGAGLDADAGAALRQGARILLGDEIIVR